MPEFPIAKNLRLTDPVRGRFVLLVQVEDQEPLRFEINKDQVLGLNADSANILLRNWQA